ncbi:hypothetical protein V9T40_014749 [Parthenolecanium corni]|uniref:Uncharacterized protein n=1 Tax=Parthenolecanium corni TaxID=536013 RepID=A0AAN9XX22_9HEMI
MIADEYKFMSYIGWALEILVKLDNRSAATKRGDFYESPQSLLPSSLDSLLISHSYPKMSDFRRESNYRFIGKQLGTLNYGLTYKSTGKRSLTCFVVTSYASAKDGEYESTAHPIETNPPNLQAALGSNLHKSSTPAPLTKAIKISYNLKTHAFVAAKKNEAVNDSVTSLYTRYTAANTVSYGNDFWVTILKTRTSDDGDD